MGFEKKAYLKKRIVTETTETNDTISFSTRLLLLEK